MNRDTLRTLTRGETLTVTSSDHSRIPEGDTLTVRRVDDRPGGLTLTVVPSSKGYPFTLHACTRGSSKDLQSSRKAGASYLTVE